MLLIPLLTTPLSSSPLIYAPGPMFELLLLLLKRYTLPHSLYPFFFLAKDFFSSSFGS